MGVPYAKTFLRNLQDETMFGFDQFHTLAMKVECYVTYSTIMTSVVHHLLLCAPETFLVVGDI